MIKWFMRQSIEMRYLIAFATFSVIGPLTLASVGFATGGAVAFFVMWIVFFIFWGMKEFG